MRGVVLFCIDGDGWVSEVVVLGKGRWWGRVEDLDLDLMRGGFVDFSSGREERSDERKIGYEECVTEAMGFLFSYIFFVSFPFSFSPPLSSSSSGGKGRWEKGTGEPFTVHHGHTVTTDHESVLCYVYIRISFLYSFLLFICLWFPFAFLVSSCLVMICESVRHSSFEDSSLHSHNTVLMGAMMSKNS